MNLSSEEGLRLLRKDDEVRMKWREQDERGWRQAEAGPLVDGPKAMADIKRRLKSQVKQSPPGSGPRPRK
jgi:hypothetical protein